MVHFRSSMALKVGCNVRLQRIREYISSAAATCIDDDERGHLLNLDGKLGTVQAAGNENTYFVQCGQELVVAKPAMLLLVGSDTARASDAHVQVDGYCLHKEHAGIFKVAKVFPHQLFLQNYNSTARLICAPDEVTSCPNPEESRKEVTSLRQYQQDSSFCFSIEF